MRSLTFKTLIWNTTWYKKNALQQEANTAPNPIRQAPAPRSAWFANWLRGILVRPADGRAK